MLFVSAHRAPDVKSNQPPMHTMSSSDFIDALQQFQGLPEIFFEAPELRDLFLPVLQADFCMDETYSCPARAPLPIPISVYGGNDDPVVHTDELDAWQRQTSSDFRKHVYQGGHFYLTDRREDIARKIRSEFLDVIGPAC